MSKLILLVLSLVLVAGCIGSSGPIAADNGLIVNEFSADPVQAEADDAVSFLLDVENVGGTTARCVTSELFGVDSWRDELGQPLSQLYGGLIGPSRGLSFNFFNDNFNICYYDYTNAQSGGLFGNVCVNRVRGVGVGVSGFLGGAFTDFTNQFCNSFISADPRLRLVKFQPDLTPPQPSLGRPGQSEIFQWILRPPLLPEGASADYTVTSRTSFFYSTNSVMNVQAFNKAEFKRRADLGQATEYPLVVENSFGSPIQVFVERGSSPIVVNPDAISSTGPYQFESYKFEIANLGQGFPLPMSGVDRSSLIGPQTQSGFVAVVMSVNGPGVFFSECLGQPVQQGGTEVVISPAALSDLIKIRADQRVPVPCTIAIDRTRWATNPIGTITFTTSMWYRYYIDREAVVKVIGAEGITGQQIISQQGRI